MVAGEGSMAEAVGRGSPGMVVARAVGTPGTIAAAAAEAEVSMVGLLAAPVRAGVVDWPAAVGAAAACWVVAVAA